MSDYDETYYDFFLYEALPRHIRMVRFTGNYDDLPAEARASHHVELTEFGRVIIHTPNGPAPLEADHFLAIGTADEWYPISPAVGEFKYRLVDVVNWDDPAEDAAFEQATQATREAIARAIREDQP